MRGVEVQNADLNGLPFRKDVFQQHTFFMWDLGRMHEPFNTKYIEPGEDGLIIFSGCRSATFLPQVWGQLPEPQQFLAAVKHKAGLSPHREVAGLMAARYQVQKWKETEAEAS